MKFTINIFAASLACGILYEKNITIAFNFEIINGPIPNSRVIVLTKELSMQLNIVFLYRTPQITEENKILIINSCKCVKLSNIFVPLKKLTHCI